MLALSACAKQPPPLPTTCADAQRERTVSTLVCTKGCSREEAERYVAIEGLAADMCAREQTASKQRDDQLRREADREFFRLHPDNGDLRMNALERAMALEQFEDQWLQERAH